jgi:capsular polysaccharide transport system permease protein
MPGLAQSILWYNPILHLTGIMRAGFYPMYRPEYVSVEFVLLTILVPMTLGLLLLRRYHRELLNR